MNLPSLPIFMILVGICLCGILLGYIIADGMYRLFSSITIDFTNLLGILGLIGFVFIVIGLCLLDRIWKEETK